MKKTLFIMVLTGISIICFYSCEKEAEKGINNQLAGYWVNAVYADSLITMDRAGAFINNQYGVAFLDSNKVKIRSLSGFCATPPPVFDDFVGTWQQKKDTVFIHVAYWGGFTDYIWLVLSVNSQALRVKELFRKNEDTLIRPQK